MESTINNILARMQPLLTCAQLKGLRKVLASELAPHAQEEPDLLPLFLTAKEVEGCSPRTITYYESTIQHMATALAKPFTQIESDDLRRYLADYEATRSAGKVTIDNIRRVLSSFFSWLENEDYIVKSPVRRIRRVKTAVTAKEVLSDEELETLRDSCATAARPSATSRSSTCLPRRACAWVNLFTSTERMLICGNVSASSRARATSSAPYTSMPAQSSISRHTSPRALTTPPPSSSRSTKRLDASPFPAWKLGFETSADPVE